MRSSPFSINAEVVEFSLDVRRYDRAPALSLEERSALSRVIGQLSEGKAASPFVGWPQLHRLIVPLLDLCHQLRVEERETSRSLTPFFVEMHQRGVSFWDWSEAEWIESIGLTRRACQQHHGNPSYLPRMEFLAAAYLFGGFSNFSVFPKNSLSFARLANDVFGEEFLTSVMEQVQPLFLAWGYAFSSGYQRSLRQAISLAFLINRSPRLEDLSADLLKMLQTQAPVAHLRQSYTLLLRALVELGMLEATGGSFPEFVKSPQQYDTVNIAPEWVDWCFRWQRLAVHHSAKERYKYVLVLLKVGRWLAHTHPDITSPTQWTTELALD